MSEIFRFLRENIFSVVTAVIALVALWQTHRQIKLSNKQHLFDKRLEAWLELKKLYALYEEHRSQLKELVNKDDVYFANNLYFLFLTNTAYMSEAGDAIKDFDSLEAKRKFLTLLEKMQDASEALHLLFTGQLAEKLSNFIASYRTVLNEMFKYQILLKHMQENSQKWGWDLETAQHRLGEERYRKHLQNALRALDVAFQTLSEEKNTLEKQIKLG